MSDDAFEYKEVDGELVAILKPDVLEANKKIEYEMKYRKSGIPVDYWNLGFKDAIVGSNREVVSVCRSYYQDVIKSNKRYNLFLYGRNTTGKTTTACAIGKEFIANGKRVKFVLADHLIDLLMKTSGYSYIEELEKEKQSYERCDLIIIDDAFDEKKALMWKSESNNQILSRWDSFLRHIVQNNVRMVITSNIPFERIANTYTKSISELLERNFKILTFEENVKQIRKKNLGIE